ncbi:autotransporter outer membrane beta-barrel domain-containing protein [Bartonella rattimassiliensis]
MLFNIQINAHAESLEVSGSKKEVSDGTYETLHTLKDGQIFGNHLTVIGNKETNINFLHGSKNYVVIAEGSNSTIELLNGSIIKGIDSAIRFGLETKNGGTIKMTGGSITVSNTGAEFIDSKGNKLDSITISSDKNDAPLVVGVAAHDSSQVTLENVKITQARTAIIATNDSKITISKGSFDGTVASQNHGTIKMTGGKITSKKTALSANTGGHIDTTNVFLTTNGKGSGAIAHGTDSTIKLHGNTEINNTLDGLGAFSGGKIISENLTISFNKAIDQNSEEDRSGVSVTGSSSIIELTGKTIIKNVDEGFYVDDGGKIISGDLTMIGDESKKMTVGVNVAELGSLIELNGKTTIQNFDMGLTAGNNSTIKMINGNVENEIKAKTMALSVISGGHIDLTNVSVAAEISGLQFIDFLETKPNDPPKHQSNEINLTNADIHIDNGTGILIGAIAKKSTEDIQNLSIGTLNLNNSEIHTDVLLDDGIFWNKTSWNDKIVWNDKEVEEISNGNFTLNADHSTLEGRANIAQERNVRFDLKNNTKWTLKISNNEKDADGNLLDIAQRSRSDISTLNLDNSSIIFNKQEDHYQTLHIGSGKPDTQTVYTAVNNAKIYFNAKWNDGAAIANQKTDRLLINGNISGNTSVYVNLEKNNVKANTSAAPNVRGLSLIQVSGKATESSFKLVNGYMTIDGSPDMYTLRAYGPESSQGKANIEQNLFDKKNENFWDFRLQPVLLGSNPDSNPDPNSNMYTPVPQTASYLVMPNVLFYTGLTDIAKQNALLADMRTSVLRKEEDKQTNFFLYTYGNTGTLASERGPLKYGYGADIRYAALQAGITLMENEGQNTTTRFGLVSSYGQLSFTPKDIADAGKSILDKWSLTAYGNIHHNNSLYIDTLLSYGMIKGNITNALIGETAKLNDTKMLSISTTVGKEFAIGMEGLTFEPQAQLAYQHLIFKTIHDADNLIIDMKNPSQWLFRVGGCLTQTISTKTNRAVSFYGKVNLLKTFGDDSSIHIGRDFDLEPTDTSLEGGIGINAQLSRNLSLHGDVNYQQKLQKTGISGASFSGGLRYQF